MNKKKKRACPVCGSRNIASYLYGMPAMDEELERDIANKKVICAGCCVSEDDPLYHCNDCGKDFGRRAVRPKLSENTPNALFRGKIKSLCLTTSPSSFPDMPEFGDDMEQCLTITAKGYVKVCRKISGGWDSDKENQTVTEKVKISPEDTERIFNRIARYFAKEHEPKLILDGGVWDLKLTNTEGKVFRFYESTCYNHRSALSRVSKLIRQVTGLEYVLGFDEDT